MLVLRLFLKLLETVKSSDEIYVLFDGSDGSAYEQIVSFSQWPIDKKYSMENLEALKEIIIWEELIHKREKQLNAIKEGVQLIGFLPFIKCYTSLLSECFDNQDISVTHDEISKIID